MIDTRHLSSQIQNLSNLVQQTVNQFVVKTPGSAGSFGISGFIFDILDREELNFESEITDSYVEDNTPIQDHIALRPERFTLKGYVGELSTDSNKLLDGALFFGTTLQNVLGLLPTFTTQANQTYSSLQSLETGASQALIQGQSLYNLFSQGSSAAQKQQNAFNYFYSLWLSRQLCTVETPYKIFSNMAIESVRAIQNGDTKIVSEFSVTFKMIRKTSTIISNPSIATAANVAEKASPESGFRGHGASGSWPELNAEVNTAAVNTNIGRWANLAMYPVQAGPLTAVKMGEEFTKTILSFNKSKKL